MTPDVIQVRAMPDYALLAQFETGEWRLFDMRDYLQFPAFSPLRDKSLFELARVVHGTVAWTEDIDLSPDTLYLRGKPWQESVR